MMAESSPPCATDRIGARCSCVAARVREGARIVASDCVDYAAISTRFSLATAGALRPPSSLSA